MILNLAWKNVVIRRKRYGLVMFSIAFGFCAMTLMTGSSAGILQTMRDKAARYFAGHASVTGYGTSSITDPGSVVSDLGRYPSLTRTVSLRTIYYRTDALLFFNGDSIKQRRLVGLDFEKEASEWRGMQFLSGGISAMKERGGILISEAAAAMTGARIGDEVMLFITSDSGQYNTVNLVVRGVFAETSLFGYISYVRREDLNQMLGRDPSSATDVALYFWQGVDTKSACETIRSDFSKTRNTLPSLESSDALTRALDNVGSVETYAFLTVDAHLAEIKYLIDALVTVTWFILAVFVLVTMVGILNTYRVLVYERIREIGTMRAVGMSRGLVQNLFVSEAALVALVSVCLGFFSGTVLLFGISLVDFSSVPGAGLLFERGRVRFMVDWVLCLLNLVLFVFAAIAAAWGPAKKASMIEPAQALRTEG